MTCSSWPWTPQVESRKHTYPYKTGLRSARFCFLNFSCNNQRTAPFSADSNTNLSISTAILLVNRSVLILVQGISGLTVIDTTYLDDTETLAQAIQYIAINKYTCHPQYANSCHIMCTKDESVCTVCSRADNPPYVNRPIIRCANYETFNAHNQRVCPGTLEIVTPNKGPCTGCQARQEKRKAGNRLRMQAKRARDRQARNNNEEPETSEQQDNDDDNEEPEAEASASSTKITVESLLN